MSDTPMTYQQLGNSGLTVSRAGLGCNTFGATVPDAEVPRLVRVALAAGITFFDTADVYSRGRSERLLGEVLGTHRDDVIIATKFGMDTRGLNGADWGVRGSRRYIRRAVEGSLRRLGTDYIDLYQMHQPDPHTPLEETLAALNELVAEGKVRYLGCSNFRAWQLVDAYWLTRTNGWPPLISAQNPYNLLSRDIETELIPAADRVGASILPYFPLASGLLTGKYRRGERAPEGTRLQLRPDRLANAKFDVIEALQDFAAEREITLLQVAAGWLAAQPAVASVIAGASKPEQVSINAAAVSWEPTPEDMATLAEITG